MVNRPSNSKMEPILCLFLLALSVLISFFSCVYFPNGLLFKSISTRLKTRGCFNAVIKMPTLHRGAAGNLVGGNEGASKIVMKSLDELVQLPAALWLVQLHLTPMVFITEIRTSFSCHSLRGAGISTRLMNETSQKIIIINKKNQVQCPRDQLSRIEYANEDGRRHCGRQ